MKELKDPSLIPETFRNHVQADGKFQPDAGRYHLYISYGCPWATRTLISLYLKGLEEYIGLSVTHYTWQKTKPGVDDHTGWTFANPNDPPFVAITGYGSFPPVDVIPDTVNNAKNIRELYDLADKNYQGRYTVPILWDKKCKTIVNNESSEIRRIFNNQLNNLAMNAELDLYPEHLRAQIDETGKWIHYQLGAGVYRGGFADVFDGLDKCEKILGQSKFIVGDQLTEVDISLYVCLIRFDVVYQSHFKMNKKYIHEYPNLREYVKYLYSIPEFRRATNMHHIINGYFSSMPNLNKYSIIPPGPDPWWEEKSSRS